MDKNCALTAAGNENDNDNASNIIFTTKGTKLYVPVLTLSVKDNPKLSKLLSKGFEKSVYWNEHKTKSENKNKQMNKDIFSNKILLELIHYLF